MGKCWYKNYDNSFVDAGPDLISANYVIETLHSRCEKCKISVLQKLIYNNVI